MGARGHGRCADGRGWNSKGIFDCEGAGDCLNRTGAEVWYLTFKRGHVEVQLRQRS